MAMHHLLARVLFTRADDLASNSTADSDPLALDDGVSDRNGEAHEGSPVVAFIIGLAIVLLSSLMNAGGLNLTKLDHVRTSAIPKASRRKDWLRPLWLIGMLLYILSQLIGSTLALRYLRAEYVAPLGSTSLIFNFVFASMLIGTPVTATDIYGTIVVILGVIGIVAFGSINSGLESGMDLALLSRLWGRANWILLVIFMSLALFALFVFASQLDRVLLARSDISSVPFAGQCTLRSPSPTSVGHRRVDGLSSFGSVKMVFKRAGERWDRMMGWTAGKLETWTAAKEDKTLAWTLGIVWACVGGGLAGGCLVFAKATVQLLTYASTLDKPASQFAAFTPIFTLFCLAFTAVMQILCLNKALKSYDSTTVVPIFYGVYTGLGFLFALVFNDEVSRYRTWTLVLICLSILVLVSGVVLLTHKKPEPGAKPAGTAGQVALSSIPAARKRKAAKDSKKNDDALGSGEDDLESGEVEEHERGMLNPEGDASPAVWELGEASDEEEGDDETLHGGEARNSKDSEGQHVKTGLAGSTHGEEGKGLMRKDDEDEW